MKIVHIVGARPNFMKVAPVMRALNRRSEVTQFLIHTGQHYDINMSDVFFRELEISPPDLNLSVGPGSHARQTAEIMVRLENFMLENSADIVLVYGDVNSTLAAALVCAKLGVPVGHVEAGLRSFDRSMPEEINRVVTDQLSDLLFTPSEDGDLNLSKEGIPAEKIFRVGNVMIDSLIQFLPAARERRMEGLPSDYAVVTLHRPANVDDDIVLKKILESLIELSRDLAVVFPVHPRTRKRIAELGLDSNPLRLHDPLPYLNFLSLLDGATVVITDSGGIQEETTYLGVPCLTMRDNTERPITVSLGTNVLIGRDSQRLRSEVLKITKGGTKTSIPPLWDGKASERIADVLLRRLSHPVENSA